LCGGNPRKENLSIGKPEIEAALIKAEQPGIGIITTLIFPLTRNSINLFPGSEIPGVPESETNAKFFPFSNKSAI